MTKSLDRKNSIVHAIFKNKNVLKYGALISLLFLLIALMIPKENFEIDMWFWQDWSRFSFKNGIANIYNSNSNYHPVWLYFLYFFGLIQGSEELITQNIYYVKIIPLVFDFLGAMTVFYFVKFRSKNYIIPFFLLFNVAYLYNSVFWGQLDSIPTFFIIMSVIFALKNKGNLSVLFFVLGLNTKLQAIIFFPVIGLLLLPQILCHPKRIIQFFSTLIISQAVILLPFLWTGTVSGLWEVVTTAVGHYPKISMNAHNLWFMFFDQPQHINDTIPFLGMTPKFWGFFLFFLFSFITLLPLLVKVIQHIKSKAESLENSSELTLLCGGLITIVFFFFNTQMHERYSHSALLFFFLYGLKSKNYWLYGLTSLAYFLNMEKLLNVFPFLYPHTFIFNPQFIATIYLAVLLLGIWKLYKNHALPVFWLQ